jgi:hypothetical protein
MKVIDGTVVFEERQCSSCLHDTPGQIAGKQPCATCSGTGKGKRGKVGGCQSCHGYQTQPDFDNLVPCPRCQETGLVAETITDTIPSEIVRSLPVVVIREDRRATWNEQYLGLGSLWSTIDYGRSWQLPDAEVIAQARESMTFVQACKVAPDGILCQALCILLHRQGYTLTAVNRR